ncbi:MAG: GTPase HflX [Limnochordia bacterium]|jgi:GTP-binding protein HflX
MSQGPNERGILVGCIQRGQSLADLLESLDELALLLQASGGLAVGRVVQTSSGLDSATYVSLGKVDEIRWQIEAEGAGLVVFDDELSPAQARNLENMLQVKVVDRTQLILDIFAQRAQSKEGKLQVELAQLTYLLPRLTGLGTELSRLGGGIGTRGPGETRLETDRRRIRRRIAHLRRALEEVRSRRCLQRRSRRRGLIPTVALVGYTNSGKSTLLNRLTGADVFIEDQPFATLDPTVRRAVLPDNRRILLVDTVGFIRKLPHQLVAAFRATLEEVVEADVLVHVVDAARTEWEKQCMAAVQVLEELGAGFHPLLTVFNKVDLLSPDQRTRLRNGHPDAVLISARHGWGIPELLDAVGRLLPDPTVLADFHLPYDRGDLVGYLHDQGQVLEERYTNQGIRMKVIMPRILANRLAEYRVAGD